MLVGRKSAPCNQAQTRAILGRMATDMARVCRDQVTNRSRRTAEEANSTPLSNIGKGIRWVDRRRMSNIEMTEKEVLILERASVAWLLTSFASLHYRYSGAVGCGVPAPRGLAQGMLRMSQLSARDLLNVVLSFYLRRRQSRTPFISLRLEHDRKLTVVALSDPILYSPPLG